jgi:hypothetical protein
MIAAWREKTAVQTLEALGAAILRQRRRVRINSITSRICSRKRRFITAIATLRQPEAFVARFFSEIRSTCEAWCF